jgi:hypothetical protein
MSCSHLEQFSYSHLTQWHSFVETLHRIHEIAILCNPLWDCNCNAWMQMYKVCRRQKNGAYVYWKQLLYDLNQVWEPQNSCHYKFTSSGDKHFSWLSFIHYEYLCTGMVKPLPIRLGKAPGKPILVSDTPNSLGILPNIMGGAFGIPCHQALGWQIQQFSKHHVLQAHCGHCYKCMIIIRRLCHIMWSRI